MKNKRPQSIQHLIKTEFNGDASLFTNMVVKKISKDWNVAGSTNTYDLYKVMYTLTKKLL